MSNLHVSRGFVTKTVVKEEQVREDTFTFTLSEWDAYLMTHLVGCRGESAQNCIVRNEVNDLAGRIDSALSRAGVPSFITPKPRNNDHEQDGA